MNAVLRKELRTMLRDRRGWLVPMIYAALLSAIVFMFLVPTISYGRSAVHTGEQIAAIIAVVQMMAIGMFAPLLGAAAIASERERGTWTSLLSSPVARN